VIAKGEWKPPPSLEEWRRLRNNLLTKLRKKTEKILQRRNREKGETGVRFGRPAREKNPTHRPASYSKKKKSGELLYHNAPMQIKDTKRRVARGVGVPTLKNTKKRRRGKRRKKDI